MSGPCETAGRERVLATRPATLAAALATVAAVVAAIVLAAATASAQVIRTPEDALRTQGRNEPPVPVVLVPGWGDGAPQLASLQARFVEAGWPPGRVATVHFQDPYGSNREHAREIGREIEALRAATDEPEVDVVAHSMGGLAVRHHLAGSDGRGVRRVVFLATPHRGTTAAHLAWGTGGEEMEPGSPFLDTLNARPAVPDGVEGLNLRTPLDLRVVPRANATVPSPDGRVRDREVCCPTHPGMLDDPDVFRIVVGFLRSEDPASAEDGGGARREPR